MGTFIVMLFILLTMDILLSAFAKLYWRDYAFIGVAIILMLIVAVVNAK